MLEIEKVSRKLSWMFSVKFLLDTHGITFRQISGLLDLLMIFGKFQRCSKIFILANLWFYIFKIGKIWQTFWIYLSPSLPLAVLRSSGLTPENLLWRKHSGFSYNVMSPALGRCHRSFGKCRNEKSSLTISTVYICFQEELSFFWRLPWRILMIKKTRGQKNVSLYTNNSWTFLSVLRFCGKFVKIPLMPASRPGPKLAFHDKSVNIFLTLLVRLRNTCQITSEVRKMDSL